MGNQAKREILSENYEMAAVEEAPLQEEAPPPQEELVQEVVEATSEDFSRIFKTAEDYDDVVNTFDEYEEAMRIESGAYEDYSEESSGGFFDGLFNGFASRKAEESVSEYAASEEAPAVEAEMAEPAAVADGGSGTSDFSTTNLQVEGVDEGDIVKTDGKYIYVISGSGNIKIIKIDGAEMKEVSMVTLDNYDGNEMIIELYMANERLSVVTQGEGGGLREAEEDVYYIDSRMVTNLYTYDLSRPEDPKPLGKISQDGSYNTTRKVGDYLYLFTDFYPKYMGSLASENGENGFENMVPYAGEEMIEPASIYLPIQPRNCSYMVISSVNLKNPNELVDKKAILQDASDFYVTTNNIYIKKVNWETGSSTSIAKFSFKDGKIKGESAGVVPGEITDAFAINEYQDTLRVLTTVWRDDLENHVTVFDDKMNVIGKIEGLAKGETIYSARFMGETGYFVTYRNVDPLFAVDFSNPHKPKILSELKITGFSEYLHFYGKGKMLGVGWETDPDTGERKGMKLSMFDISNPEDVKEVSKLVVKNVQYFPGEQNYKALTISPEKNVIGLETNSLNRVGYSDSSNYMIFSYKEGEGFKNQLVHSFGESYASFMNGEISRGIYVNDIFYIVTQDSVTAFDMAKGYSKIGEISD